MLKKIALLMMLVLPMGVFAQNLKFGHINAMEIVSAMPEYSSGNFTFSRTLVRGNKLKA